MKSGACAFIAVAMLGCSAASAQSLILPDMGSDFTAPRYFDGLYTGVALGVLGNERHNFFAGGGDHAFGPIGIAGFNRYLGDGLIVGGELQGGLGYDFAGNIRYDAFALAHLGFTTSDTSQAYFAGGVGWFHSAPAFALGVGVEWGAMDNMSLRAEALAIGQLGTVPTGLNFGGFSAWQVSAGALWRFGDDSGARPQETLFGSSPKPVDFGGLYSAAYFGGTVNPNFNFYTNTGSGWHQTRLTYGAAVGWNQEIAEHIIAGVELQGGLNFNTSGDVSADAFALGRVGLVPMEGLFVYAQGGVGVVAGRAAYALGAGAEYGLWEEASLRADVLAIGELNATPVVSGISATKVTIGPVWHFD